MDSACATLKKIDTEVLDHNVANGGAGQQLSLIKMNGSRCVTVLVMLSGTPTGSGVADISVGDEADGSDQTSIPAANFADCATAGTNHILIRLNQVFGEYVRVSINPSTATTVSQVVERSHFRDSDNIQPTRADTHVCDVICVKP